MLRPATPLTVFFFVAFILLLLSTISTPVVKSIPLGSRRHTNGDITHFGVFGYCTGDVCSKAMLGYSISALDDTPNSGAALTPSVQHNLSSILVMHPIAALLTFICTVLAGAAHFRSPAHSPKYLLALLILSFPTLFITLLAFLIDILIFIPHMLWGGWIVLAATIILMVCMVLTCAMRRTLVNRKARKRRIAENADMNGENYYAQRAEQENDMQFARAESPPPIDGKPVTTDKGPSYAAYEYQRSGPSFDDRAPLNMRREPSSRSASTNGRHNGNNGHTNLESQDDGAIPLQPLNGARSPYRDDVHGPPSPGSPTTYDGHQRDMFDPRRGRSRRGSMPPRGRGRGNYPPPGHHPPRGFYGRGRGPPRGVAYGRGPYRGGSPNMRGAYDGEDRNMRYGGHDLDAGIMMGAAVPGPGPSNPAPPMYHQFGTDAVAAEQNERTREPYSSDPADGSNTTRADGWRHHSAEYRPADRPTDYHDDFAHSQSGMEHITSPVLASRGTVPDAIVRDPASFGFSGRRPSPGPGNSSRILEEQPPPLPSPSRHRQAGDFDGGQSPPAQHDASFGLLQRQTPGENVSQDNDDARSYLPNNAWQKGQAYDPIGQDQDLPIELPTHRSIVGSSHQPQSPTRGRLPRSSSDGYYEDVDPRFVQDEHFTAPASREIDHGAQGVVPASLTPGGPRRGMSSSNYSDRHDESPENRTETRSPAASEGSNFTSVSQRGINPNWRPPPVQGYHPPPSAYGQNSQWGGNSSQYTVRGAPNRWNEQDMVLSTNPDFELPGSGVRGSPGHARGISSGSRYPDAVQ